MSLRPDTVDMLVSRAHHYNFDDLIQFFVDWNPVNIRESILTLHFFASNAAMHNDYTSEEEKDAIDMLRQIYEAMKDVETPKDSKLVIRVK